MVFGVLKDIKEGENRVICTPVEVASIVAAGHTVLVEKNAGVGAGFPDEKYAAMGAEIVETAKEMWDRCDFLAKVKEVDPSEFGYLRENQMIYCCIHPAGHPEEVQAILDSKCIAITAEDSHRYGSPNCEAAGKQGALFGLESMLTINGGKGKFDAHSPAVGKAIAFWKKGYVQTDGFMASLVSEGHQRDGRPWSRAGSLAAWRKDRREGNFMLCPSGPGSLQPPEQTANSQGLHP